MVVVGDVVPAPGRVEPGEPCAASGTAPFAAARVVVVFAIPVEFLYEVERTLTRGGTWVGKESVPETLVVMLRLAEGDVVDIVEAVVFVLMTLDDEELEVTETVVSVSSGTGTITIGSGAGLSLARLYFQSATKYLRSRIPTAHAQRLSGADQPRSRLRKTAQQRSNEPPAYL